MCTQQITRVRSCIQALPPVDLAHVHSGLESLVFDIAARNNYSAQQESELLEAVLGLFGLEVI